MFWWFTSKPMPSPATTPTTFHQFQLLPAELRLQIWDLAIPCPRLVFVRSRSRYVPSTSARLCLDHRPRCWPTVMNADVRVELCHGVPAFLHACGESRARAEEKFYEKVWERGEIERSEARSADVDKSKDEDKDEDENKDQDEEDDKGDNIDEDNGEDGDGDVTVTVSLEEEDMKRITLGWKYTWVNYQLDQIIFAGL